MTVDEAEEETFTVRLRNATNATLAGGGTIFGPRQGRLRTMTSRWWRCRSERHSYTVRRR